MTSVLLLLMSLICFLLCIQVAKYVFMTTSASKNIPPSPSRLPIIGNLHQLGLHPHRSLRTLAQRYGPIMLLQLGRKPAIVVSSPDLAREIMKNQDITFANRPDSRIAKKLLYNYKDLSWSPYGEYWRQMRSICVMRLLSAKRVKSFRMYREEETAELIKKVAQTCSCSFNLSELLVLLTRNLICRAAFGRKYGDDESGRKFKKLLEELGELLGVFSVGDYIPWLGWLDQLSGLNARVERVFKEFDQFFNVVIDDHLARQHVSSAVMSEDRMDLLDILLQIQKDGSNGICMAKEYIKAILLDMFAGATDTTYTVIEWAMTEIVRHPEIMKKVQEEIRGIAGSKVQLDEDDLDKMLYLRAVIKETMRLHPPVPLLLPRKPTNDVEVGGYNVAAETRVIVNAWAIARDAASWVEPEQFKPERFINSFLYFKGLEFELIPFGAGRRGCPGATFALAIVELVLANLLLNFNWALPGGAREEDLDVSESSGMSVHKKDPLIVLASPHSC